MINNERVTNSSHELNDIHIFDYSIYYHTCNDYDFAELHHDKETTLSDLDNT